MNNSVCEYKIEIKNTPEDIYKAVGQITELAQDWESRFKELARVAGVRTKKTKDIEKYSLNKLNEALRSIAVFDERIAKDFKEIIDRRNYINHSFFLEYKAGKRNDLTESFTDTATYICEATDFIENMIKDIQKKPYIKIPTVFDKGAVFE